MNSDKDDNLLHYFVSKKKPVPSREHLLIKKRMKTGKNLTDQTLPTGDMHEKTSEREYIMRN